MADITRYVILKPNGKVLDHDKLKLNKLHEAEMVGVRIYTEGIMMKDTVLEVTLQLKDMP